MVKRQGVGFNNDYKIMILEIPDKLKIRVVQVNDLPAGRRSFTDYGKIKLLAVTDLVPDERIEASLKQHPAP